MAITTLDGVIAGMRPPVTIVKDTASLNTGRWFTPFYRDGMPGAATAPTPGQAGAALTSYPGQLPVPAPVSGKNIYLARFQAMASIAGCLILCDRLWHNSGLSVTSTGTQTVNSVAWPARDANGTSDGEQVLIAVEVTSATGNGSPSFTMSYTNSQGTTGRTGTSITPGFNSAPAGTFIPMGLAAGDTGVRSVQTFTLSASWSSGAISLVAYRELARLELTAANVPNAIDALTSGMPRLFDDSVPFLVFISSVPGSGANISGTVVWTQG